MNEDTPEQPEKYAEKNTRSQKKLPFGHGLVDATPPPPEPPAEEPPQPPLKEEAPKPPPPVAQEEAKKDIPFGFGVLGAQPVDDTEPETEAITPDPPPPVERAPEADKNTSSKPTAFDILPFADAPPPKHETPLGPDALPTLEGYEAPIEEEAAEEEPVTREETISSEPTVADPVATSLPAEPEEAPVEPDETVPDYFDEIVEYKIVEPPDDEEDDGFNSIPSGPMQEVRFDERPHRRSRDYRSRERARPQTRPPQASKPVRQTTPQTPAPTSTTKKKLSPMQLAAIIAGAGIALAIVIWIIVTVAGK